MRFNATLITRVDVTISHSFCIIQLVLLYHLKILTTNNRERFHPFAPGTHLHWAPPGPNEEKDWYEEYNKEWGVLQGKDCCAPDSVSFHYVKKASMVRHMHALINFCNDNGD